MADAGIKYYNFAPNQGVQWNGQNVTEIQNWIMDLGFDCIATVDTSHTLTILINDLRENFKVTLADYVMWQPSLFKFVAIDSGMLALCYQIIEQ